MAYSLFNISEISCVSSLQSSQQLKQGFSQAETLTFLELIQSHQGILFGRLGGTVTNQLKAQVSYTLDLARIAKIELK